MRTGGIWRYHMATSWRSLAMLSVIVLVVFIGLLALMMPYTASTITQEVNMGTGSVVVTQAELDKPRLSEPFGTSGMIYSVFMLVFACTSITADRRYLLSNNVTRYEFMLGTFLAAVTMSAALTSVQYVLDLLCRIATYAMGFQLTNMVWSPRLIWLSTSDYLPALISQMGNLVALAGFWTLTILLFARWKKTCIALCVMAVLLPVMLANFLPANWLEWVLKNASYVVEKLAEFFSAHKDLFLIDVPAWRVLFQQTAVGALMYAIGYLVIRRLPVRTK